MEDQKRVYPSRCTARGGLNHLLLFLSALVILSGLVWRGDQKQLSIQTVPTDTPIPLKEAFDETQEQRDITLPSSVWYALQLGAFEEENAAKEFAAGFQKRGAAGFVWNSGRYRALAAVYPDKEDAQTVRQQLMNGHQVETYLYQIELPAIVIRLKGMRGQLDILEASFLHANDLIRQLQELSVAMDRQESSAAEALASMQKMSDPIETVALRLRQRFAAPRHQTVTLMLECLEDYVRFAAELDSASSEAELGMQLKYQTLSSLYRLKQVYDTLTHT